VSAGRLCDYSGMTYRDIGTQAAFSGRFPAGAPADGQAAPLRPRGRFQPTNGKGPVNRGGLGAVSDSRTAVFPLVLNTGRTVEHWHYAHQDRQRCRSSSGCRRTRGWR
jgi:predicted molibdopterin-dependent oxidoreductase YjgC